MNTMIDTLKKFALTMAAATVGAGAAMASDHFARIGEHANNVERDSLQIHQSLKSKKADTSEVKQKLEGTKADIDALHKLVAEVDATNSSMSERDRKDWEFLKQKVQLLEIFHGRKAELAGEDVTRNRGMIRAHAQGLAKRAAMLRETASRLQKGSSSGRSGS